MRTSSGVVPYRFVENDDLEVLLVRATGGKAWVFPKGGVEVGLDKKENAVKEAWEEAGVIGVVGSGLGTYHYKKNEQLQVVTMYAMSVVAVLDDYPEVAIRARQWVKIEEAYKLLKTRQLQKLLDELLSIIVG